MVDKGGIGVLPIPPRRSSTIHLDLAPCVQGRCFLRIIFRQQGQSLWANAGEPAAHFQFELPCSDEEIVKESEYSPVRVQQNRTEIFLAGDDFEYKFDAITGAFSKINAVGANLLSSPMRYDIHTAAQENSTDKEFTAKLKESYARVYEVDCRPIGDGCDISAKLALCINGAPPIAYVDAQYIMNPAGDIQASFDVNLPNSPSALPGFGLTLPINRAFDDVTYFGMGPTESRADQKSGAYKGLFKASVSDMTPASGEHGQRYATEWAAVQAVDKRGIMLKGEFILAVKADCDAVQTDVYAGFLGASGAGIAEKNFRFDMLIRPIAADGTPLQELSATRYDWDEGYTDSQAQ